MTSCGSSPRNWRKKPVLEVRNEKILAHRRPDPEPRPGVLVHELRSRTRRTAGADETPGEHQQSLSPQVDPGPRAHGGTDGQALPVPDPDREGKDRAPAPDGPRLQGPPGGAGQVPGRGEGGPRPGRPHQGGPPGYQAEGRRGRGRPRGRPDPGSEGSLPYFHRGVPQERWGEPGEGQGPPGADKKNSLTRIPNSSRISVVVLYISD